MEATGIIIKVFPLTSGKSQRTGNTWHNQVFVLQTEEQFPKKIPFEVFGEERISKFAIKEGERLTINFDIDAHEYQGMFYPKIKCYNVTRQQQDLFNQPQPQPVPQTVIYPDRQQPASPPINPETGETHADDLPF